MEFDPNRSKPALVDENDGHVTLDELKRLVHLVFRERIPRGCARTSSLHFLKHMEAILEVRVVYPAGGSTERWIIDLSRPTAHVAIEDRGDEFDFVVEVTASSLYAFAMGETRSDILALSGAVRSFSRAYRIVGGRLVTPAEFSPPGLHRDRTTLR